MSRLLKNLLYCRTLKLWRPPGHFYSPIPSLAETKKNEERIFCVPSSIPGIDLNEDGQVNLFQELANHYADQPYSAGKKELRYICGNPNFSSADAIILHCMIRHTRPRRIIEIGSGYSSCVTLDTNDLYFGNSIDCTFIEPYPELLFSLLGPSERHSLNIISSNLQDVGSETFSELAAGDLLFIDSTHISKIDSDVNHLLFRILPSLSAGVNVHFHDIPYPFEYPREWVYEGRAWNEAYLLRAFLQYNSSFRISFFSSYFAHAHQELLKEKMPLCAGSAAGSIWLQKVA